MRTKCYNCEPSNIYLVGNTLGRCGMQETYNPIIFYTYISTIVLEAGIITLSSHYTLVTDIVIVIVFITLLRIVELKYCMLLLKVFLSWQKSNVGVAEQRSCPHITRLHEIGVSTQDSTRLKRWIFTKAWPCFQSFSLPRLSIYVFSKWRLWVSIDLVYLFYIYVVHSRVWSPSLSCKEIVIIIVPSSFSDSLSGLN